MTKKKNLILDLDHILKADDLKIEAYPIPEWGGDVLLRELSSKDRQGFASMVRDLKSDDEVLIFIVERSVVNGSGEFIFKDCGEKLLEKNGRVVEQLFHKIMILNGLDQSSEEEAEKN